MRVNVATATLEGPVQTGIQQVQLKMDKQPKLIPDQETRARQDGACFGTQTRGEPPPLGEYPVVMTAGRRGLEERAVSILKEERWMHRR